MMTDCATLNDLINVIATPCPTLLCIYTSLYTGAYLSSFRRTSYYQFGGGKTGIVKNQHIQICYVSEAKMGEKRQCLPYMLHVYTQMQDVTLRAKDQRS